MLFFRLILSGLLLMAMPAMAQTIERAIMPGEVIEGHKKLEEDCAKCHVRFDRAAQDRLCLDCHKEIAGDVQAKRKLHGLMDIASCRSCHTDHKGRSAKIAEIDKKKFDHAKTGYRLQGGHNKESVKCESCHDSRKKYREVSSRCVDCHHKEDQDKGHKGKLGAKCESCHDDSDWKKAKFDHEKTRFSLVGGKHAEVKCRDCHADSTFQNAPMTCIGCHKKDDQDKGHKGQYGNKCESCHTDKDWKKSKFDHDIDTRYPLKAKHRDVKCSKCHQPEKGGLYQIKWPTKCIACHSKDDQEKGHRGELGERCDSCHTERGWKQVKFDHDETKFPLRFKHKESKCEDCHKGGVSGTNARLKVDTQCVSCHRKLDQDKGHKGRYGEKCESCHTDKGWKPSIFNHDKSTKYALKGKHKEARCDDCHLPARGAVVGSKTETACYACHRKDDKHRGQLGTKCESCHAESKWTGVAYDHNRSRFPLTGSHAKVECKKCHQTPAFRDAPSACVKCHEKDDKHKGHFGDKCDKCHYTGTWHSWDFDHATTRFRLDGAHAKLICDACHGSDNKGKLRASGRSCYACHGREDPHNGSFGIQCEQCHITSEWGRVFR